MRASLRLAVLLSVTAAFSSPPIARGGPPERTVTRADLAAAYLRFERVWRSNPPPKSDIAGANRSFDRASFLFFGRNYAAAVQEIDALTALMLPESARSPEARLATSLKVVIEPQTYIIGSTTAPVARVYSMYLVESPPTADVVLTLRLRHRADQKATDVPFTVVPAATQRVDVSVPLGNPASHLTVGLYDVIIATTDGVEVPVRKLAVVEGSLDVLRKANEVELAKIRATTPARKQALAACRARNRLLTDTPSEDNSAQFLADPAALVPQIAAEIDALRNGKNPYSRRVGDTWRVFLSGDDEIPVRVYAPADAKNDTPIPLVIVLHGAGGDENMFLDGYGAGRVKELADQHGFLVASPLTYPFLRSSKVFDRLVRAMAYDYPVDRDRVYVLGHSMGAAAAARLARSRNKSAAAVCCLCGGGSFARANSLAPTLIIGAELDPMASAARLEIMVKAAAAAGLPVEFRCIANYGHTLVVGEALPDAIDWLLKHHRGATTRPSRQPEATTRTSESPAVQTKSSADGG